MNKTLIILITLILGGCHPVTNPKSTSKTVTTNSPSVATEAILRLDTHGHTSRIGDIITTKEGDIISASSDKTIRIWDSHTGKEKRKILGEIERNSGEIFSIALNPNENFLAVGGKFKGIRIYDYKTGKLIKVLKSHSSVVLDLAFSSNGLYLISGSADKSAKIWRSSDWELLDTIKTHHQSVHAVQIIQENGENFAITAGDDKKLSKYSIKQHKTIKTIKMKNKLRYLANSSKDIALCGKGKEITILDYNLNKIHTLPYSQNKPSGLSYSSNGKLLIAGSSNNNVKVYDASMDYQEITTFRKHNNLTMAVAFIDNQTAVSAGGNNKEIYIWDINRNNQIKDKIIEGVGATVWSIGIKNNTIAWGNESRDIHNPNSLTLKKSINLEDFSLSESIHQNKFKSIPHQKDNYTLKSNSNTSYSGEILNLLKNGKTIASIKRDKRDGYGHNCYGFYKEYIISGGSNGYLKIYNFKGEEVANLVGHTGEIWTIAVDGDRLVSGSSDQTIRVWNLSNLKTELLPTLNIFVSRDNQWVVWSNKGYFNSSIKGDKYVGYHINKGSNHEANYVPSDSYYKTLYRADIIENIWKTGDESQAIKIASRNRKIKKVDVINELPPIISLITPSFIRTDKDNISIKYNIESQSKVEQILVTRNGQKIDTRAVRIKTDPTVRVDLEEGKNIISIKAKNSSATSDALIINVIKKSSTPQNIYKPTLYLLTIGVSKYANPDYNLGLADIDAKEIGKMFKNQEGRIYKKVVLKELLNNEATSGNIMDALDWIERETTQRDIAIIFIAGHGINDEKGNYYFMSHNGDTEKLRRTAVKWIEIEDTIKELPSKVVLLVDTCHSGNIQGSEKRRDITSAIKSIVHADIGSVIMTATTGKGYSYEKSEWGHGAFTKALLEAIKEGKADYNKDGEISIKEIDLYITNRVKELTKGKQKPTTLISDSIPDFTIGMK